MDSFYTPRGYDLIHLCFSSLSLPFPPCNGHGPPAWHARKWCTITGKQRVKAVGGQAGEGKQRVEEGCVWSEHEVRMILLYHCVHTSLLGYFCIFLHASTMISFTPTCQCILSSWMVDWHLNDIRKPLNSLRLILMECFPKIILHPSLLLQVGQEISYR